MRRYLLFIAVMIGLILPGIATAQTSPPLFTSQDHPVFTLASYYNAINRGEFARAYGYWHGSAPNNATLAQFTQGFAQTQSVRALVRLPIRYGAAAGSSYAETPIILISTLKNGTQQLYAGCFTTRKSNVPAGNAPQPDPNWYLYSATLKSVTTVDFSQAVSACPTVEAFPMQNIFAVSTHPIDTLTSYYDAIARAEFTRAYGYWGGHNQNQTAPQFAQGFTGTSNIGVIIDLNVVVQGAAGSSYAEIPVLLTATSQNVIQWFTGCYVFRQSNVPVGNAAQPDPNWYLYTVNNTLVKDLATGIAQVNNICASQ